MAEQTADISYILPMTLDEATIWKADVERSANELRRLLHYGYTRRAWEALGYPNWTSCLQSLADEFGLTERRLWQLHSANQIESQLNNCSVGTIPEGQLRTLIPLPDAARSIAWQAIVETAPGGKVTAKHAEVVAGVIQDAISRGAIDPGDGVEIPFSQAIRAAITEETYERMKRQENYIAEKRNGGSPHISQATGNEEWFTPADIVERARRVMGSIDLDPASCAQANEVVRAIRYYTLSDDGLQQVWTGRLFLNPPYSRGVVELFIDKLTSSLGGVTEAVVLVNNATETEWCQKIMAVAEQVCLLKGRVRFWGNETSAPLQGQAIFHLRGDCQSQVRFYDEFSDSGTIWVR